jgi:hypothetical protein
MSSVDHSKSSAAATAMRRKVWETPTIVVQSAGRNTYANINNPGTDGIATTGSSYGS